MSLAILAEAIVRLEHKVDALCRHTEIPIDPLSFVGTICPVCHQNIDYKMDVVNQVVVRYCGCFTGKVPSTMPSLPVAPPPTGVPANANPPADSPGTDGAKKGSRSKAR